MGATFSPPTSTALYVLRLAQRRVGRSSNRCSCSPADVRDKRPKRVKPFMAYEALMAQADATALGHLPSGQLSDIGQLTD
jgi:hypothetical protein